MEQRPERIIRRLSSSLIDQLVVWFIKCCKNWNLWKRTFNCQSQTKEKRKHSHFRSCDWRIWTEFLKCFNWFTRGRRAKQSYLGSFIHVSSLVFLVFIHGAAGGGGQVRPGGRGEEGQRLAGVGHAHRAPAPQRPGRSQEEQSGRVHSLENSQLIRTQTFQRSWCVEAPEHIVKLQRHGVARL